jgi:uncharacterized membrane protein/glutaredoxin
MSHRHIYRRLLFSLLLISLSLIGLPPGGVHAQEKTVHAVLFYSPSCPHCHEVMTEVIPPLEAEYGAHLEVIELDTSQPQGQALFQAAVEDYQMEMVGVPTLIVGEHALVGSREIPEQFPTLIEEYLSEGGVGWPDLPGMQAITEEYNLDTGALPTLQEKFARDIFGNTLAVVVLIGLAATFVAVIRPRAWHISLAERYAPWAVIAVLIVGMIAASYLSYVEVTQSEAVCGPVGDCNTVQQSRFALLFGFLPMAVFGLIGYVMILGAFVYATWFKQGPYHEYAPAIVFALSMFGLAFSIYLTYLEPFVIGATCAWCLTSAIAMALLALLTAGPGWPALEDALVDLGLVKRRYWRKRRRRSKRRRRK